jgi:rhamnose transport system ATP-binding protein
VPHPRGAVAVMAEHGPPALEVRGISKRFGATVALDDVSMRLERGEVHCLVGENGAGKSTLAKIITGVQPPDTGTVEVEGETVELRDVQNAQRLGISAVYQHPMTFPDLTVAENVFAGRQPRHDLGTRSVPFIDWGRMRTEVAAIFERLDIDLDPGASMAALSVADQQMVEIAKALSVNARVLILDEPTASLSSREVASLFSVVRDLVEDGVAIVFITHRLDEVFELGDRVTVLRDGEHVGSHAIDEVDRNDVIRMMVGREVDVLYPKEEATPGDVVLEVRDLHREGVFSDISFAVRAGEIVGLAGLVGAGRTEVARGIFGVDDLDGGEVNLAGERIRPKSPSQMMRAGLGYVPEDRHTNGLVLPWPLYMNITLAVIRRLGRAGPVVAPSIEREVAKKYIDRLSIRTEGVEQPVTDLSGGNQQKALLAKWLATEPRVLILDEPTHGVDVGAKAEVHRAISDLAQEGIGIILISSELPELLAMSDRVLVMCEGRITGHFTSESADQEMVMAAATDLEASLNNVVRHGDAHGMGAPEPVTEGSG